MRGGGIREKLRNPRGAEKFTADWSYNAFRKRTLEGLVLKLRAAHPGAVGRPPVAIPQPTHLAFDWHEPDRGRDCDNVSGSGRKLVIDALVEAGWLADDGPRFVAGFGDERFFYPGEPGFRGPGVEVYIRTNGPTVAVAPGVTRVSSLRAFLPGRLPDWNEDVNRIEVGVRRSLLRAVR